MRVNFDEVTIRGTKTVTVEGKRRKRSRSFSQTINPFNKKKDGSVKSRQDIIEELLIERNKWISET